MSERYAEARGRALHSLVVRAARLAVALVAVAHAAPCTAAPHPVDAKAIWTRAGRVYVAARDSSALGPGWRVQFLEKKKPIAAGQVTEFVNGELAAVRLDSGSLERVKHLDRLAIVGEAPAPMRRAVLRIGGPSWRRPTVGFDCGRMAVAPPDSAAWQPVAVGESHDRFAWMATVDRSPWPDTLAVRLFDDAIDEEIALERGELDVAVFWPGERSEHLRHGPRWRDPPLGARARGVIAGHWASDRDSVAATSGRLDLSELARLNEELFRSELAPIASSMPRDTAARADAPVWPRFVVDASMPGGAVIDRFLKTLPSQAALVRPTGPQPILVLSSVDAPVSLPNRPELPPGLIPLFAVRCPVVCSAELRDYVRTLGADAIVAMFTCGAVSGAR